MSTSHRPPPSSVRFSRRSVLRSVPAAAGVLSAARSALAQNPAGAAPAAPPVRPGRRLDSGWEHYRGTLGGIWEVWRGDKASDNVRWSPVTLPHCFNATDAVDPDEAYYQGHGWYRTRFKNENPHPGGRTLLLFEGAGQRSEVYVNLERVGEHLGGYDEFTLDITAAAARASAQTKSNDIPLAVLCDNGRDLERIPSSLSDFMLYGGLYRPVSLVHVPAISLQRVLVESKVDPAKGKATVTVKARLHNPDQARDALDLAIEVRDPRGQVVHTASKRGNPWPGEQVLADFSLDRPELWSPEAPALYQVTVTCKSRSGQHPVTERFGLRHVEWKKQGPFVLNGRRLLLRGTHRHEDHAGLGAALSDDLIRQEMQLIKDVGANFIRLGHYQQSRLCLQLCDELGLLVWEEIPWCRGGLGGERYRRQARDMLRAMIDQHRNHPSVILWGLGNENDWPGDFPVFDEKAIRAFMKELHDLAHQLDPSRQTAIRRCDFCKDIVDVYSPSIWAGWYRGQYTEYKKSSEEEMKKVNHFLHVEWGGDSHARRHSEDPDRVIARIGTGAGTDERGLDYLLTGGQARASRDGDWSETYICNLFDWHLKEQETMDWLTGTAQWVFKDFATPLRPENPVPRMNQKGLVERDLTPKEAYYVFQSYWSKKPMVHIYGRSWPVRWGTRDENKMIKVYSNCPEVELFVNGRSAGRKKRASQDFPAAGLRWLVRLRDGQNELRAVGHQGGVELTDRLALTYQTAKWDKPARLVLETSKTEGDVATVQVRCLDKKGVLCLDARNPVRFDVAGDGRLLDNLGTSTGARQVELYNGRALISLRLNQGVSVVSVSSKDLPTAVLNLSPRRRA
jgi:beta-galactosidase